MEMEGVLQAIKTVVDVFDAEDGVRYFRIAWKDTWEPETNLISCEEILDEFWKHKSKNTTAVVESSIDNKIITRIEGMADFECQAEFDEIQKEIIAYNNSFQQWSPRIQCSSINTTSNTNIDKTENKHTYIKLVSPRTYRNALVQCNIIDCKGKPDVTSISTQCHLKWETNSVDVSVQHDDKMIHNDITLQSTIDLGCYKEVLSSIDEIPHDLNDSRTSISSTITDVDINTCDIECQCEPEVLETCEVECQCEPESKDFAVQSSIDVKTFGLQVNPEAKGFCVQVCPQTCSRSTQVLSPAKSKTDYVNYMTLQPNQIFRAERGVQCRLCDCNSRKSWSRTINDTNDRYSNTSHHNEKNNKTSNNNNIHENNINQNHKNKYLEKNVSWHDVSEIQSSNVDHFTSSVGTDCDYVQDAYEQRKLDNIATNSLSTPSSNDFISVGRDTTPLHNNVILFNNIHNKLILEPTRTTIHETSLQAVSIHETSLQAVSLETSGEPIQPNVFTSSQQVNGTVLNHPHGSSSTPMISFRNITPAPLLPGSMITPVQIASPTRILSSGNMIQSGNTATIQVVNDSLTGSMSSTADVVGTVPFPNVTLPSMHIDNKLLYSDASILHSSQDKNLKEMYFVTDNPYFEPTSNQPVRKGGRKRSDCHRIVSKRQKLNNDAIKLSVSDSELLRATETDIFKTKKNTQSIYSRSLFPKKSDKTENVAQLPSVVSPIAIATLNIVPIDGRTLVQTPPPPPQSLHNGYVIKNITCSPLMFNNSVKHEQLQGIEQQGCTTILDESYGSTVYDPKSPLINIAGGVKIAEAQSVSSLSIDEKKINDEFIMKYWK